MKQFKLDDISVVPCLQEAG